MNFPNDKSNQQKKRNGRRRRSSISQQLINHVYTVYRATGGTEISRRTWGHSRCWRWQGCNKPRCGRWSPKPGHQRCWNQQGRWIWGGLRTPWPLSRQPRSGSSRSAEGLAWPRSPSGSWRRRTSQGRGIGQCSSWSPERCSARLSPRRRSSWGWVWWTFWGWWGRGQWACWGVWDLGRIGGEGASGGWWRRMRRSVPRRRRRMPLRGVGGRERNDQIELQGERGRGMRIYIRYE